MGKVQTITVYVITVLCMVVGAFTVTQQPAVAAGFDPFVTCSANPNCAGLTDNTLGEKVKNIINTTLLLLGGVAIIMVVVGGIRLSVSRGDASQIKAGRETVLYALVGIVVAISAAAIVNFVASFNW